MRENGWLARYNRTVTRTRSVWSPLVDQEDRDPLGRHLPGARRELAGAIPVRVARRVATASAARHGLLPARGRAGQRARVARDHRDRGPRNLGPPVAPRPRPREGARRRLARSSFRAPRGAVGARRQRPPADAPAPGVRTVRGSEAGGRRSVPLPRARSERARLADV